MEVLALLYTFLLVTICLLLAVVLYRTGRPQQGQQGTEALAQLAGTTAGGTGKGECPPAGGAGAAE